MNPSTVAGPELQLPQPVNYNQSPDVHNGANGGAMQPERPAHAAEQAPLPSSFAPQPGSAQTPPQGSSQSVPQITQSPTSNSVSSTGTVTSVKTPHAADDSDLIEKEWVAKAKQIVEKTRDDPHAQSQELTVFKADYLQKRYQKTIKLGEQGY